MSFDKQETARVLMETFRTLHRVMHKAYFRSVAQNKKPTFIFVMMRLLRAKKNGIDGLRVSEIAGAMGISVPAVTQLVTELEKEGLVRREMDPSDRRAVLVSLTEAGTLVMAPAFRELEDGFFGLIDFLGEQESATLADLLVKSERYFSERAADPDQDACVRG